MIKISPEERAKKAHELFESGYNCAQAVAISFSDVIQMDEILISKLISGFGGGFGRMREVCGAVSGGVFVLNALFGDFDIKDNNSKANHYSLIQELLKAFEAECGSYVCRDLLKLDVRNDSPTPEMRTSQYYRKRPCAELCSISARITSELIISKL